MRMTRKDEKDGKDDKYIIFYWRETKKFIQRNQAFVISQKNDENTEF